VSADFSGQTFAEVRRFLADWTKKIDAQYCMVSLPPDFEFPANTDAAKIIEHAIMPHGREHNQAFALMIGVRHLSPMLAGLEQQDAAVGSHSRDQALKALVLLDQRLKGREWLAADRLTMADIVAFIGLDFTRLIRLALPENLTEVARWAEAMRERPAAKA
jgi:glutathione S-transferase